jgi:2-aminobenzoate-CoA ligase
VEREDDEPAEPEGEPERGSAGEHVVLAEGVHGDDAKVKELQDFAKQQIAPYKYPRVIEFVTEIPRTATGKLQRFRLRDRT